MLLCYVNMLLLCYGNMFLLLLLLLLLFLFLFLCYSVVVLLLGCCMAFFQILHPISIFRLTIIHGTTNNLDIFHLPHHCELESQKNLNDCLTVHQLAAQNLFNYCFFRYFLVKTFFKFIFYYVRSTNLS